MKTNFYSLVSLLALLSFSSCTVQDSLNEPTLEVIEESSVTLIERENPWRNTNDYSLTTPSCVYELVTDLTGSSMALNYYPFTRGYNFGWSVIDIDSFAESAACNFQVNGAGGETSSYSTTFSDFSVLRESIDFDSKIYNPNNLNCNIIESALADYYADLFSTSTDYSLSKMYGEFNYLYLGTKHQLQYDSQVRDVILKDYLSSLFLANIHRVHPAEIFDTYGPFVITGYYTGASLTVHYYGNNTSFSSVNAMRDDFSAIANLSTQYDNSASVSITLGIDNISDEYVGVVSEFDDLLISTFTAGGDVISLSGASWKTTELQSFNWDYSTWAQSVTADNYYLVDFTENSLVPISDFILEENLRDFYIDYLQNGIPDKYPEFEEPEFVIEYNSALMADNDAAVYGEFLSGDFPVNSYIKTRFGDKILVKSVNFYLDNTTDRNAIIAAYRNYVEDESLRLYDIASITVTGSITSSETSTPRFDSSNDLKLGTSLTSYSSLEAASTHYQTNLDIFKKESMSKATINDITYIICNNTAYSIENTSIIRDYDIDELLTTLPEANITFDNLLNDYTVFAL